MASRNAAQTGFTLLELLVALAVFGILSAMAYGGLRTVLNGRDHVESQSRRLTELQRAYSLLAQDIEQALGRTTRDSYGQTLPALSGGGYAPLLLELTRTGWRNPAGLQRSQLQRVGYRLEDGKLYRGFLPVLDQAQNSESLERQVLENVKGVELRFLDATLQWREAWPDNASPDPSQLPRAVEISIDLEGFGKVRRVFRVPPGEAAQRAAQPPPPPVGGGSGGGGG